MKNYYLCVRIRAPSDKSEKSPLVTIARLDWFPYFTHKYVTIWLSIWFTLCVGKQQGIYSSLSTLYTPIQTCKRFEFTVNTMCSRQVIPASEASYDTDWYCKIYLKSVKRSSAEIYIEQSLLKRENGKRNSRCGVNAKLNWWNVFYISLPYSSTIVNVTLAGVFAER